MAPTITSSKVTLKYPIFCADFFDLDDDETGSNKWALAVGGGGGQGRSGVGNRITILGDNLQSLSELELSREEDSVMSLCTTPEGGVLAGINSASEKILGTGVNEHLRGFRYSPKDGSLAGEVWRKQVFSNSTVKVRDSYQRVLRRGRIREDGQVVALASGGGAGKETVNEVVVGRIHGSSNLSVLERVDMPPGTEAVDIDITEEETENEKSPKFTLAYCHPKNIFLHSNGTSTQIFTVSPPTAGSFRAIRLLSPTLVIATLNAPSRSGAEILLLSPTETLLRKPLHKGIKAVTAIDAFLFPGGRQALVAIAGADMAIEIVAIDLPTTDRPARLRSVKIVNAVHPFQITKVAIAQPRKFPGGWETRIATTSIGQTVVVFTVPLLTSTIQLPKQAITESASEENSQEELQEPLYVLPPRGAKRTLAKSIAATASTVLISLGLVVIIAIILQVLIIYRGGLPDSDTSSIVVRGREFLGKYVPIKPYDPEIQQIVDEAAKEQEVLVEHSLPDGRRKRAQKEVEDVAEVVKDFVHDAAEVAGEWVVEEGRKVAGGVVKGMLRGAVEDVVQNIMRV